MTPDLPSRAGLDSLMRATDGVAPAAAVGTATRLDDGGTSVVYVYAHGCGEFVLPDSGLPAALHPAGVELRETGVDFLQAGSAGAIEAFLRDTGARQVLSVRLSGARPSARAWMALAHDRPLTAEQRTTLTAMAHELGPPLTEPLPQDERYRRLVRLEEAARLIPALLRVLDVRDVVDRLSAAAKSALPHDLLLLNLFSDDFSTFTVYARSDKGPGQGMVRPNPYSAAALQAWTFSIVDDHTRHPIERHSPATQIGARASLRFPIRFDDRVIGGVTFVSFTPHAFGDADIPVGRRLADHVASAISHFQLADRLAQEALAAAELRARTTNLELLDELLGALTDTGGVQDTFGRISEIAQKVIAHDALALPVFLPGGRQARRYAATGAVLAAAEIMDLPPFFLDPSWEVDLVDDAGTLPGSHNQRVAAMGFASVLRLPIRLSGRNAAALVFLAKTRAAFKDGDVLVARRIADRLAVSLAREHSVEADRRADEATERATRLEARVQALTQELDARTGYRRVIGESPTWRRVLTQATQVAATETTALLLGESGTGKEVIARFIHRGSSRHHGPFIALNCAALPEQLLEAELFGYERGAFTGATQSKPGQLEQAAGGTLFLDEVGEMSLPAQAKFLRVLQEREFQRLGGTRVIRTDARIVAATNRDLQKAIANSLFRDDLYYRLNVFAIRLPPLRERKDDILPLTEAFLSEFGRSFASPPAGISRDARQLLLAYDWPGNIRELRNTLERAAILCDGGLITQEHLASPVFAGVARAGAESAPLEAAPPAPLEDAPALAPAGAPARDLASTERAMIQRALQDARFNKSKAARELGLTRHQLYIRMRRHGLGE